VNIVAIGKSQYSGDNINWIYENTLPIVIDQSPYDNWASWGANQRDLYFLDQQGNLFTKINISTWDYSTIYNNINLILSSVNNLDLDIIPNSLEILEIYPNPFNPITTIKYLVNKSSYSKVSVYNLRGEQIKILRESYIYPGVYTIDFNASDKSSGIYFIKLINGNDIKTQKVLLAK